MPSPSRTAPASEPAARVAQKLIALAQIWRREIARAIVEFGISDSVALPLIHLLRDGDGVTQSCLAARVGVDGSSLVRVLDALEQSGDIERVPDARDRRAKLIQLTARGRETARRLDGALFEIRARVLADVSEAEVAALDHTLGVMLATFDGAALDSPSSERGAPR